MELGLKGQRAIVLGASRGIGRSIALGLAGEGVHVAICARNAGALHDAEALLKDAGVQVFAEVCDIADPAALTAYLAAAHAALGGIDILVQNASALALGADLAAWQATIQLDLLATVTACETVLPWMQAAGGGNVIIVSSISALEANPFPDYSYTAIKAALNAYAKKLAGQYAAHGIRVNALAPGAIDFPGGFWDNVRQQNPGLYQSVIATIPSGRFGTPEEVADAAVFLSSPRAQWITGACVVVDGGQSKAIP